MNRLPLENEVLAGKYRVERVVGRGGMGVVLSAWHLALDQRVALKCLQPELAENAESAERFLREARAAAKIKSEHSVRVLDVSNFDSGVPYLVMEFLDGRDLADELREHGPFSVEDCISYTIQAIDAVAEAHALGIVHRDLKPENLFLARLADGTRRIKVLDFGISKSMVIGSADNRSLTQSSTIMGSPLYMSPEQMRAPRSVDARTDIWSLGAIMYELLAGHAPYVADTLPQLCAKMLESDPPPLRAARPDVDPELEYAVTRCLARKLEDRWSSMGELAHALIPFANRSSRVIAERAGRSISDKGSPVAKATMPSGISGSATPARLSSDMSGSPHVIRVPTPAGNAPRSQVTDTESRASWENPHASQQRSLALEAPTHTRRGVLPWVLGGSAVAIGIAAWFWSSDHADAARTVTPVLSANVAAFADQAPAAATAKDEVAPSLSAPPAAATATPEMSANAEPAVAPAPDAATLAGSPLNTHPGTAPPPIVRRNPPPPTAPNPAPTNGKGLTDFGGRR